MRCKTCQLLGHTSKHSNFVMHCKNQRCTFTDIMYKNNWIKSLDHLQILGITFDSMLNFKNHCINLRKQLESRFTIIKSLSSKTHQYSYKITRALRLSKIDNGLPIYGWCPKSHLQEVLPAFHGAVRRVINAFPTSPTRCILGEAGLPSGLQVWSHIRMHHASSTKPIHHSQHPF